ncbi:unnamed protein product, partial [Bubo scandiacus]
MRGPLLVATSRGFRAMGAEGPLARTIRAKLAAALQPTHLQLLDDTPRHGGPPEPRAISRWWWSAGASRGCPPAAASPGPRRPARRAGRTPARAGHRRQDPPTMGERPPRAPRPPCLGGPSTSGAGPRPAGSS